MKLLTFLLLLTLAILVNLKTVSDQAPLGTDFMQDYAAATAFRQGEPLYGPGIGEISFSILGRFRCDNYHPPTSVFLYIPLSFLSYLSALWVWFGVSLLSYVFGIACLLKYLEDRGRLTSLKPYWFLTPLLLLWFPWVSHAGLGQLSSVLFFLVTLSLISPWPGAFIGIAASLKLFPAYLALSFIIAKKNKSIVCFSVTFAAVLFGSVIILGLETFQQFFFLQIEDDLRRFEGYPLNHSLLGVFSSLFSTGAYTRALISFDSYSELAWCVKGVLAVGLLWSGYRSRISFDRALGVAVPAMLITCPISWSHASLFLLIPLATAIKRIRLYHLVILGLLTAIPDPDIHRYLSKSFPGELVPGGFSALFRLHFWAYCFLLYLNWPRQGGAEVEERVTDKTMVMD